MVLVLAMVLVLGWEAGTNMPDNLLDFIRLSNMFAPENPIDPFQQGFEQPPPQQNFDIGPMYSMADLYQPEHMYQDRMGQMLDQFPQRPNPGIGSKIFASLAAGAGGPDAADRFMYGRYGQQLADWKNQFEPTLQAANQERYSNSNMRQIASSMINQDRLERSMGLRARQGDTRLEQGWKKIEQGDTRIANRKEDVDADNARADKALKIKEALMNGGTQHVDDDGNAYILTRDGRIIPIEDVDYRSAEEKSALRTNEAAASAGARAKATAANQKDRKTVKPVFDAEGNITSWEIVNLDQETTTPLETATGQPALVPPKPVKAQTIDERARQVQQQHPDWMKYIRISPTGKFLGVNSSGFGLTTGFGPDEATRKKIVDEIYGAGGEGPTKQNAPANVAPNTLPANSPAKTGSVGDTIRVRRKSDGKTGSMPRKNFDASKYEEIK